MNVYRNKAEQGSTGKDKHLAVLADTDKRRFDTRES